MTVKRPALKYYGSQWQNFKHIRKYFPPLYQYNHFLVPFCGGANVLLQMPVTRVETATDLNGRVINFFQVLRDRQNELIAALSLTPWHQGEYVLSYTIADDSLEDARRFFFCCWMSIHGGGGGNSSHGFRWTKNADAKWSKVAKDGMGLDRLHQVATRLKEVQFIEADGIEIIEKLNFRKCLIYADPPFPLLTRGSHHGGYDYDSSTDLHERLAEVLNTHEGMAVVSGKPYHKDNFPNLLYERLFEDKGWVRHDYKSRENAGTSGTHCVWVSPRTEEVCEKRQLQLL